jgi:CRISPR system Cascade subunit CasD
VRVDQPGHPTRDYQSAKSRLNKDAYVTTRYYLEDAVFVAAVGHEDDAWVSAIAEALRTPYFQPFMGRRSCPVPADLLLDVADADVLSALNQLPWQAADWHRRRYGLEHPGTEAVELDIYADAALVATPKGLKMRRDEVISFSQSNRRHRFRNEAHAQVTLDMPEMAAGGHDAFAALGGV